MMPGWGTVAGWIFDRLPNKKEGIRSKIQKIQREMDEITKKKPSNATAKRYMHLASQLRKLQDRLENI